jgi:hypothetical protein
MIQHCELEFFSELLALDVEEIDKKEKCQAAPI